MAEGTQLWDKSKTKKLYPISDATVITSNAANAEIVSNVHADLKNIFEQLSALNGDKEAVNNIEISVKYKASTYKKQNEIDDEEGWASTFIIPTVKNPYTWKRTTITYKGQTKPNVSYEICSADTSETTEIIYKAVGTGEQPSIPYELDKNGNKKLDQYDEKIPEGWSSIPIEISASSPFVYMSSRVRKEGKWGEYSEPKLFGKWAYDSIIEIRYATTSTYTEPQLIADGTNPGNHWYEDTSSIIDENFKGYLWMITATSTNNQLNKIGNIIWRGPNLISIVK